MARQRNWKIEVEGADELANMFDNMAEKAKNVLSEAAEAACEIVLESAKRNVPVKTGKLKASIAIKKEKSKKDTKGVWQCYVKGVKSGGVRYGYAVEAGTKKRPAKPYLRPALDNNRDRIKEKISQVIAEKME